jgi:hypothetical protein
VPRLVLVPGLLAGLLTLSPVRSEAQEKKAAEEPDVVQISTEKFACNADVVTIDAAKGKVQVKKKDSTKHDLPGSGPSASR